MKGAGLMPMTARRWNRSGYFIQKFNWVNLNRCFSCMARFGQSISEPRSFPSQILTRKGGSRTVIRSDKVKVGMNVESIAKALNKTDCTKLRIWDFWAADDHLFLDLIGYNAQNFLKNFICLKIVTNPFGKANDPSSNRNLGNNVLSHVCSCPCHISC